MNFTFGILTDGKQTVRVNTIIDSIERQNILSYEIIVVGGNNVERDNCEWLPFDESGKPHPWITKKKNMVTKTAQYDNIVYLHDYIMLTPGWYDGHVKSGEDFNIRMDKMINADNTRFRDWTLDPYQAQQMDFRCLLPYDVTDLSRFMYISGAYWVAKKSFMQEHPLDERLYWGCAEDMKWSRIINKVTDFSMNINSTVQLLKMKPPVFTYAFATDIERLRRAIKDGIDIQPRPLP